MTSLQSIPTTLALTGLLMGAGNSLAGDDIPNLVGTWQVRSEAAEIMMGTQPTAKSIASGDYSRCFRYPEIISQVAAYFV